MSDLPAAQRTAVAVKARPITLARKMRADDAFRLVLAACIAQVVANAAGVASRDGESLHQIRVGLRRLQASLRLFAGIFAAAELARLRLRVKAVAKALAPARDLDVLIEQTLEPMALAIGIAAYERLRHRAEPLRRNAWDQAVAVVESRDFTALIEDIVAVAGRRHHRSVRILPVAKLARFALDDFHKTVRRRGRGFASLAADERHALRIALKHMRYASEIFASLYRRKRTLRYIAALRVLQDGLGDLNDGASAMRYWGSHPKSVVGRIEAEQRARDERLNADMQRAWKTFKKQKPFWK